MQWESKCPLKVLYIYMCVCVCGNMDIKYDDAAAAAVAAVDDDDDGCML